MTSKGPLVSRLMRLSSPHRGAHWPNCDGVMTCLMSIFSGGHRGTMQPPFPTRVERNLRCSPSALAKAAGSCRVMRIL